MRLCILTLSFLYLFGCNSNVSQVSAQEIGYTTANDLSRRDANLLQEARVASDIENWDKAINIYDRLLERNPNNINLLIFKAGVRANSGNDELAIKEFEAVLDLAPNYDPELYEWLGELYKRNGRYALAAERYRTYLTSIPENDKARYDRIASLVGQMERNAEAMANPVPFDPQPLGPNINTEVNQEYFASVSPDGNRLIFTRNLAGGNEDFYESLLDANGNWQKARPLPGINTEMNEGAQTLSADGQLMVFTMCNAPGGAGSCDLYFSERRDGFWTKPKNIGESVNTRFWESQPSLSADGKLLFFTSNRPGGKGKRDLWGSARKPDGSWTRPINLGDLINTSEDDHFPSFHPDGKTLYFTSEGQPGLGGNDLFLSRLDENNRWGAPENLGYPINDTGDEKGLFVSLDGRWAYYAREIPKENKRGVNVDIYRFEMPESIRPAEVTYLKGRVVDSVTGKPLVCHVRLRATDDERKPQTQNTDEAGEFLLVLPAGKTYALIIDEPGYLFHTEHFDLEGGADPDDPFLLEVALKPITELVPNGEQIVLENVLFATGSAELLAVSGDELDRLVELLQERPDLRIELAGHTDNVGSTSDNQLLSESRAEAVYDYLIAAGIAQNRLQFKGYGESQPIADNNTETGRAANRRTTFTVLAEQ
ncbi:MAG: OmpA family protein [Bacteroidota bacterium]